MVRQDDDLGIKFKRGEVARGDDGNRRVVMILGVDDEPIDLLLFDGADVREVLLEIHEAIEVALVGLRRTQG